MLDRFTAVRNRLAVWLDVRISLNRIELFLYNEEKHVNKSSRVPYKQKTVSRPDKNLKNILTFILRRLTSVLYRAKMIKN